MESADAALKIDPTAFLAWDAKALCLCQLARYDEAITCHDCAIVLNGANASLWEHKASTLEEAGRYEW
jgi:tetratricopeptide (TPR) repeat protein